MVTPDAAHQGICAGSNCRRIIAYYCINREGIRFEGNLAVTGFLSGGFSGDFLFSLAVMIRDRIAQLHGFRTALGKVNNRQLAFACVRQADAYLYRCGRLDLSVFVMNFDIEYTCAVHRREQNAAGNRILNNFIRRFLVIRLIFFLFRQNFPDLQFRAFRDSRLRTVVQSDLESGAVESRVVSNQGIAKYIIREFICSEAVPGQIPAAAFIGFPFKLQGFGDVLCLAVLHLVQAEVLAGCSVFQADVHAKSFVFGGIHIA